VTSRILVTAAALVAITAIPSAALRVEVLRSVGGLPPHIVGTFEEPANFQQAANGVFYVFDRRGHAVHSIDSDRRAAVKIVNIGPESGRILQPTGFDMAPDGRGRRRPAPNPPRTKRRIGRGGDRCACQRVVRVGE